MKAKLPLFLVSYEKDGACLVLNSNTPVKARIAEIFAENALLSVPSETVKDADGNAQTLNPFNQGFYAAFWILEGYVSSASFNPETQSSLAYYWESRNGLAIQERWQLYLDVVDITETGLVVDAYLETRKNKFETEADTPLEEKKSE